MIFCCISLVKIEKKQKNKRHRCPKVCFFLYFCSLLFQNTMKNSKWLSVFFIFILSSCFSDRNRLAQSLEQFEHDAFELPKTMLRIQDGAFFIDSLDYKSKCYVFYFDTQECTRCTISSLHGYKFLFDLPPFKDAISVLIVLSPQSGELDDIIEMVINEDCGFPVFIDIEEHFKNNPFLRDRLFRSFLLNENKYPILVGDPTSSGAIYNLLIKILESDYEKLEY